MNARYLVVALVLSAAIASATPAELQAELDAIPQKWDSARGQQLVVAAKQAREQGDANKSERLCYLAFLYVDRSTIVNLGDFADILHAQHRPDEAEARARATKLREVKAQQAQGTEPSSAYLGFAPWDELAKYANLLEELGRPTDAAAVRALADANKYVQQAQFARTMLYRQGKDPRGTC